MDRIGPNRKTKINRMDRIEAMWIEQGRSGQNRTNVDRMDQIGQKWTKSIPMDEIKLKWIEWTKYD